MSLRIWMYDPMEVNIQMGRSFWLENLFEKYAYEARNPDWIYILSKSSYIVLIVLSIIT